jgi:hypothetical protein
MSIVRVPPPDGAYRFVVLNNTIHAEGKDVYPYEFTSYGENKLSRCIEVPWLGGQNAHFIFWNTKPAFERSLSMGWIDVTQRWADHIEATKIGPTTDSQKSIMDSLSTAWQAKSDIMGRSDISDSEWRTAIKTLIEKGLVEKSGTTNRNYRYRLVG